MRKQKKSQNNTGSGVKIFSRIMMLVGLCVILAGIAGYYQGRYIYNNKIETCTAVTQGTVTACERQVVTHTRRHAASRKEIFFRVIFSYSVDDKEYSDTQRLKYNPGKNTDVHYDPDSPKKSYISDSPQDTYSTDLSISILGVWVIFIGFLIPLGINTPHLRQQFKKP